MSQILNSIDCMFFTKDNEIITIKRNEEPFKNKLSLIGGIQNNFESFEAAIERVLKQKLGLQTRIKKNTIYINNQYEFNIEQIKSYDSGKDSRGGNTTSYAIQTNLSQNELKQLIPKEINFPNVNNLPELAFEHNKIIADYFFTKKNYTLSKTQEIGVTIDTVILTVKDGILKVLLAKRSKEPYKGSYTLPGGFINKESSLDEAALQILKRDTNIEGAYLEQLFTFGNINRDSRGRVISIAFYALVDYSKFDLIKSQKYDEIDWFSSSDLRKINIAFDHKEIINLAIERIKNKIEYTNIAFQLVPQKFTLAELQEIYEAILEQEIDKRNFRKKLNELDIVEPQNEFKKQGRMRPAMYYSFKNKTKDTPMKAKKLV
jgi:8-oxo-dGTP diphosphatase